MSLVLAAALAASTAALPTCSWDRPGANAFMGDVVAAVDRYADIPAPARAALKARMAKRQYDDIARITRDAIDGKRSYTDLRDMHFDKGRICNTVTRNKWSAKAAERGLVYCEAEHCVIVPTVCRNVSRVTPLPQQRSAAEDGGGSKAPGIRAGLDFPATAAPQGELTFDAPAAGAAPSLADRLRDPVVTSSAVGVPIASATPAWSSDPSGGLDAAPGSFVSLLPPGSGFGVLPIGLAGRNEPANPGNNTGGGSGGTGSGSGAAGGTGGQPGGGAGGGAGTGGNTGGAIGGNPGSGTGGTGSGTGSGAGTGGNTGGAVGGNPGSGTGGTAGGTGGGTGTGAGDGTGGNTGGAPGGNPGSGTGGTGGGTGSAPGAGGGGSTGGGVPGGESGGAGGSPAQPGGGGGGGADGGTGGGAGGNTGGSPGGVGGGGLPGEFPVSPVPETSTWLMMLAGLGAVAISARHRRGRRSPSRG